jgi:transmembrane sensor
MMTMSKQSFEHLLDKYLQGKASPEEKKLVEQWYGLVGDDSQLPQSEAEWGDIKHKMWRAIQHHTKVRVLPLWQRPFFKISAAACIVLLLGFGIFWSQFQPSDSQGVIVDEKGLITRKNTSDSVQKIQLEDGSLITLSPNAQLSYPEHFGAINREVTLTGEAFFDIKRNPEKPFLVSAGKTVTKVLGTSFWIRNTQLAKTIVEVKTGRVSVYEKDVPNRKDNGVVLTPNLKVTFYEEEAHFVAGIVAKPEVLKTIPQEPNFNFEAASLNQTLTELSKAYGIEFTTENEQLNACTLTGNLSKLPMFTQLDIICRSINASYQVKGTTILLSGKGCQD